MSDTTVDERKILVPFDAQECLSLKEAAARAGRTESTLRNWCNEYGLGRRIGGKWAVSKIALAMYLDGDRKALRAYHAGNRTDPRVVYYFEREGLAILLKAMSLTEPTASSKSREGRTLAASGAMK